MIGKNITLAFIWVIVMLIYLLGDALRIFAGDFVPSRIGNEPASQTTMLAIALLMLTPILMVFVSLKAPTTVNYWANIIIAAGLLIFNLFGLPTYPGFYDRFLIVVSMGFNLLTIWYVWDWSKQLEQIIYGAIYRIH